MIPHIPAIDNVKMAKLILLLSLGSSLFSFGALAAPFKDFKFLSGQRWDFDLETRFYKSDGNFDKSGNTFTRHLDGYSYQNINMDLGVRTGLGPRWNIYGQTRFATAESKSLSTGSSVSKTNSGLSHFQFGSDNLLYSGSVLVFSDFSFTYPMAKTERLGTSSVAIGEGTMELQGRAILRVERKGYRFGAFGGLTYRDQGRSMLVPYGFLGELVLGKWNLGTDLRGYQSLTLDKDSNNEFAIEQAYFCPVNGCAKQFGSFNPSILQNNIWARVNFSKDFGMHAGLSHDILGSNVSKGMNIYGGLVYRMGASSRQSTPSPENNFSENIDDGIDQRAFERTSVTHPTRPKRPAKPKANLQDELNKTEQLMEQSVEQPQSEE